ncbi:TGF-beta-activated kinase 1 and MAP3K7-binding protein 1 [Sciurus carolinensis]|uniref:TGF-beta-activated kinase 1 and MAP3K7-binding protein 1 n=1 Tax=Sciurus carolinensis TaxID=30640 RepID=A0AA41MRX4_SCICA|nr:TGF-beta-activated kinase 1 and MAP3K7-binding protein 1 [Sciurus carolinensis]
MTSCQYNFLPLLASPWAPLAQYFQVQHSGNADVNQGCSGERPGVQARVSSARSRNHTWALFGVISGLVKIELLKEQQPSWTDDLPLCHLSGVGSAANRVYSADGKGTEAHPPEDSWLKFRSDNNCFLYGVFNGYDGNRVTSFVAQRLSAELLLGQLNAEHTETDVRRVLLQNSGSTTMKCDEIVLKNTGFFVLPRAFDVVERSFLESIDDALAEKASLQSQLPEGVPQHQLPPQYQKILERLKVLERETSGGAMAVVAVLLNTKLYVANVGTNRALLCKSTVDGLQVTQLNVDHTTENEDELFRLSQLGLDAGKIKQVGIICGQESTRRIGDYKVKYGYTDIDLLSAAKSKPIIAEPEVHGAQPLDGVTGFLVLMSEGLYKALEAAHGPGQANQEIAAMIDTEFAKQTSLDAVAQAVVDRVKRIHGDTFASGGERAKFCPRHEDMTLLVRNFGYPLGEMSQPTPAQAPAAGGRVYPVSVPYSSAQSTSKTSVTLSLVMPSQGQMVNGAHSASTLDEATPTLTNQSPTLTLQSTNTHTQSSSSSSDGGLFRSRPAHSLPPGEDGRVEPYVDFAEFYRLWSVDHGEQSVLAAP